MSEGDDGRRDRERERQRRDEQRRDSRRPPRALQVAVAAGLGLVLLSVGALGVIVFLGGPAPGGVDVPQAEFAFAYDADTERVRVEHAGGAAFTTNNSGRLYVTVNGTTRTVLDLPFEAGDTVTVGNVSAGQEVAVFWVVAGGDPRAVAESVTDAGTGTATATAATRAGPEAPTAPRVAAGQGRCPGSSRTTGTPRSATSAAKARWSVASASKVS